MKPATPNTQVLRFVILSILIVAGSAADLIAQSGVGGGKGETVTFEVQSIDPESWVVTARDLESGESFSFRLPPDAFRGQRFRADLGSAGLGRKLSVQAPGQVRLDKAVIERPIAAGRGPAGSFEARPRDGRDQAPSGPSAYGRPSDRQGPADYVGAPEAPGRPGGPGSGPAEYEVVSVDERSWTVQARGLDGKVVSLEIDPQAFVGYRFRASVKELRSGQGFELLATNEQPLANCCTVKAAPGR